MATNEFLPFATGGGANVIDEATYAAAATTGTGYVAGLARSNYVNKTLRQGAFMAAVIGQFIANTTGSNVTDDGNVADKLSLFESALADFIASGAFMSLVATANQTWDWDHNGNTNLFIQNANTGNAAAASVIATNGTQSLDLTMLGTSHATSGIEGPNVGLLACTSTLAFYSAVGPMLFGVNGLAETIRFTIGGGVGFAGYNGGTFSNGQAQIAPSSVNGAVIGGGGSTSDAALQNKNGSVAAFVPTGSVNFSVTGLLGLGGYVSGAVGSGQGYVSTGSTNGVELSGDGASNDFLVRNGSATAALAVPHNTTDLNVVGNLYTSSGAISLNGPIGGFGTNGQAYIAGDTTNGLDYRGRGGTNDHLWSNLSGTTVMRVPTNTTNLNIVGKVSAGSGIGITAKSVSTQQASPSAGATVTYAHGLGAIPTLAFATLVCISTEAGYSVGDEVENMSFSNVSGQPCNYTVDKDATNVILILGTGGLEIANKGSGAYVILTPAKWTVIITALI